MDARAVSDGETLYLFMLPSVADEYEERLNATASDEETTVGDGATAGAGVDVPPADATDVVREKSQMQLDSDMDDIYGAI